MKFVMVSIDHIVYIDSVSLSDHVANDFHNEILHFLILKFVHYYLTQVN